VILPTKLAPNTCFAICFCQKEHLASFVVAVLRSLLYRTPHRRLSDFAFGFFSLAAVRSNQILQESSEMYSVICGVESAV